MVSKYQHFDVILQNVIDVLLNRLQFSQTSQPITLNKVVVAASISSQLITQTTHGCQNC